MNAAPPPANPAPADILAIRAAMAAAVAAGTWRTDPPAQVEQIGGRRVLCWRGGAAVRGSVLHFHGGGYRIGCPEQSGAYALALARRCGVDVLSAEYRLAPEHPFPAALDDAAAVLRGLCAAGAGPVILSGDSAGGGLAASLAVLAAREGIALAGLVLHSPWLDLSVSAASYDRNAATDALFSRGSAAPAAGFYLNGRASDDPLASALFAAPEDYPATFISVGEEEVLIDDATRLHARLRATGGDAQILAIAGMTHTAVVRGGNLPGAAETFAATAAFIDQRLGMVAP